MKRFGLTCCAWLLSFSSVSGSFFGGAGEAYADKPVRTWNYLTTGNGHGFQFFDTNKNKITHFLEVPYRYLRPRADPKSDGYGRRNLAYDFYFGVKGNSGGGWLQGGKAGEASYVEETNIIKVPISLSGIDAETYYFAPFGFEGNAMIAVLNAPNARDGFALFNFHLGDGSPDTPNANNERLKLLSDGKSVSESGPGGGSMIYVPLSALSHADCENVFTKVSSGQSLGDKTNCAGNDVVPAFQATLDGGYMGVAVLFAENESDAENLLQQFKTWVNGRNPSKLLSDGLAEWSAWRKPLPQNLSLCTDDEKKLWRQSEAVLRMGQVRQAYSSTRKNHGMVLASLPPGEWHTGWVRDGLYAIVALARMGHHAEAKMGLDFLLNAEPSGKFSSYVSGVNYRVSVCRYFGNGEEEADYSGQQTPNVEIDGWGLTLWAARQYLDASGNTAWLNEKTRLGPTVYEALFGGVAEALRKNTESSGIAKADSSIWEVHDENKKHFAYTTLSTIRGFCDFASMAQKAGNATDSTAYRNLASKARDGFLATFLDRDGAIAGSIEELAQNQYLDGAVVEAFTWNVLKDAEYGGKTGKATLDVLGRLRVESGGFKRNDDGKSSYDNNEWILIDLRMSDALWRAGRESESAGLVKMVIDKASANYFLLPELYNAVRADGAIGKYAGSIPMVGYGAGAYVLTMLDRSGLLEPNDCGDGLGNKSSGRALKCSDPPVTPQNPQNPGTPTADEVPYVNACLCQVGSVSQSSTPHPMAWLGSLFVLGGLVRRRFRGNKS
jgi:GH15 family glucan-1,4-alpha-glucosidase